MRLADLYKLSLVKEVNLMDYEYIESLVLQAKDGNEDAKEKLCFEFKPLIMKTSSRTFIHGYDQDDIINEGYRILFKCVSLYDPSQHRFVAYATNGIKKSIYDLIRKHKVHESIEGCNTLSLSDFLENIIVDDNFSIDRDLIDECVNTTLLLSINKLCERDRKLIDFLYFKENTLKSYADSEKVCYSTAFRRRSNALNNLYKHITTIDKDVSLN